MISFDFFSVIKILLAFCLYGILSSFVIVALNVFFIGFKSVLAVRKYVWSNSIINSAKKIKDVNISKNTSLGLVFFNLRDFLCVIVLGIGYLLIQYSFSDGIFRIYALFVFCVSCWLSYKFIGKYTEKFFVFIYSLLYRFLLLVITLIVAPIHFIAQKFKKLFLNIPFIKIKEFILTHFKSKDNKKVVSHSNKSVKVYKLKPRDKNG